MRKNLGKKWTFLPLPVGVIGTYDKSGKANAMTAAWATVYDYGQVFVSMAKHKTTDNIKLTKAFTIAFATKKTIALADYFGLVSGYKVNKIAKTKVHVSKAKYVNAPIIEEFPVVLECKLVSLKNGNLIGKIVNVNVDTSFNPQDTLSTVSKDNSQDVANKLVTYFKANGNTIPNGDLEHVQTLVAKLESHSADSQWVIILFKDFVFEISDL